MPATSNARRRFICLSLSVRRAAEVVRIRLEAADAVGRRADRIAVGVDVDPEIADLRLRLRWSLHRVGADVDGGHRARRAVPGGRGAATTWAAPGGQRRRMATAHRSQPGRNAVLPAVD